MKNPHVLDTYEFPGFIPKRRQQQATADQEGKLNRSKHVAAWIKSAGQWKGMGFFTKEKIDFGRFPIYTFKIWSPVAGKVMIKFFNDKAGYSTKKEFTIPEPLAARKWQVVTFDASQLQSGYYDKVEVMAVPESAEKIGPFYFYDFILYPAKDRGDIGGIKAGTTVTQIALQPQKTGANGNPVQAETVFSTREKLVIADFDDVMPLNLFGWDIQAVVTANPVPGGLDTSEFVASWTKCVGQWKGMGFFTREKLDFDRYPIYTFKIWSPVSGKVMIKFFSDKGGESTKKEFTIPEPLAARKWQVISFDASQLQSGYYDKVEVMTSPESPEKIGPFYFDDFILYPAK